MRPFGKRRRGGVTAKKLQKTEDAGKVFIRGGQATREVVKITTSATAR